MSIILIKIYKKSIFKKLIKKLFEFSKINFKFTKNLFKN